jgi:hypothetical protein
MRIGIICHDEGLAWWQARAVERIAGGNEIYLLECPPPPAPARKLEHAAYYALNLLTIRNRMTRTVPFPSGVDVVETLAFQPGYEGAWATLPGELLEWVRSRRLDVIVKFGLGLLRVPDEQALPVPIVSYHHGDPRRFRGRPAGFYELGAGEPFMGQVVQVLSNKLDAGAILAFAASRVVPHSYRKTLIEAFSLSPYLLGEALEAVRTGRRVPLEPRGTNYRLPANGTVVRFAGARLGKLARRVAYGAFVEKKWQVASIPLAAAADPLAAIAAAEALRPSWQQVRRLPQYAFYADPFFYTAADDIVVEALNARSGKGQLVRITGGKHQPIAGFDGHVSYPAAVEEAGELYLVPEVSDWSRPAIYRLEGDHACRMAELDIDAGGLLDPTLARLDDRLFLFANRVEDGPSVLHLWSAPSLFGRFEPHPASPVRVSARGSRMAGELMRMGGQLYRLGQDFRGGYGDGILPFRITQIDEATYQEEPAGEAAFTSVRGPHTLSYRSGTLLFDYYVDRVSPLAGVRRLLNRV